MRSFGYGLGNREESVYLCKRTWALKRKGQALPSHLRSTRREASRRSFWPNLTLIIVAERQRPRLLSPLPHKDESARPDVL